MPKPLNDNLKAVRVETEDGDLLPIMDVAGAKFSELIQAVTSHNKAGKLRLTIDIKPSTAGTLAVKAECSITKPKGLPAESLLWPTPEGNLLAEDPRQTRLDLKPVIQEEPKQLKQVSA
jgi:hypothetical protein